MTTSEALAAAANNAEWCDLICRAHRVPTLDEQGVWSAGHRPPKHYPDAVTLRPGVSPADVLARVDGTPGCSVKDSFRDLDLTPWGFEVLFHARWIHRVPGTTGAGGTAGWTLVETAEEMAAWSVAAGAPGAFPPGLLGEPAVRFLVLRAGESAGAIANRSTSVVGVSNVFCATTAADAVWVGIVNALAAGFPGLPLVGYERGAGLSPALRAGFTEVGPLRVWQRRG